MSVSHSGYVAFFVYLLLVLFQWAVATVSKAKQKGAVPGKLDDSLSHESFVFRAHRTFQNTLENGVLFVGTVLFSFVLGYQSSIFSICIWVYVFARILHMVLYYKIATEKNPSPRSYFFILGVIANIVMLVLIGLRLL